MSTRGSGHRSSKTRRTTIRKQSRRAYFEALESRVLLAAQPTGWTPLGVGLGGTCYYANTNPLDVNEIYLETDMGEVWHTLDAGVNWTTLNQQTQLSSNAHIDPVHYTSDVNIQYAISRGDTPKVTKDRGQTWTVLKDWARIQAMDGGSAAHLIVDPNNTNRLLMIEQKQVGSAYNYWIYYSTNGGDNFNLINTGGAGASDTSGTNTDWAWPAGSYWNGNNIYFATFDGLYKSTNGGTNWTFTSSSAMSKPNNANGFNVSAGNTSSKIISFSATSFGSSTRLWAVTWDGNTNTVESWDTGPDKYSGIYTSTDGGTTWAEKSGTLFAKYPAKVLTPRWVQTVNCTTAADLDKVWIGGIDTPSSSPIVYNSTNAGTNWTRLLKTGADTGNFPEQPNENVYTRAWGVGGDYEWGYLSGTVTFNVNRNNPNVITFTGMGTLWGSYDGGANWYNLEAGGPNQLPNSAWNPKGQAIVRGTAYNNSGANETSAWDVTFIDPNTIFVSDTDVAGQMTSDGGAHWSYLRVPAMSNPNTFYDAEYVPSTDMLYAVTSGRHDLFTLNYNDGSVEIYGQNYIMQSADHGKTWTPIYNFPNGAPAHNLAIDPNNPDIAYVALDNHNYGTGGIWKTTNLSAGVNSTWTYLANQPTRDIDNNGTQDFASMFISQLQILSDSTLVVTAGIRYAPTASFRSPDDLSYTAGVWTSTNGGTSWTDRSSVNGTGSDLYNGNQNMYYTQGNLLTTEAISVTVDPNDATQNTWYATTYYFGTQPYGTVYKTTNRGQTWTNWTSWPLNTDGYYLGQAEDLWIQPGGTIMLATTKNGLMYTPDYTVANPKFYNVQTMPFNGSTSWQITSDPFNSDRIYVATHGAGVWRADLSVITAAGPVVNVGAKTMSATEAMLSWKITGPTGTGYVIEKSTDQNTWTTAATVPDWNETSYLVTGLSANTQYYFRIRTTNSSGNSVPSATVSVRTDGAPGVIAVEEFTQAAGALNGTGSGTGWATTWAGNSAGNSIVAGAINNGDPPTNTGNHATISSSGVDASRTLSANLGTAGSVVWVGFEVSTNSPTNLLIGDSTNGIGFGTQIYSTWPSFIAVRGGVQTYKQSDTSISAGNHFFVARLEYRTDGTVAVRMFQDPTPGLTYPNNEVSLGNGWDGVFAAAQLPATLTTNKITLTKPSSGSANYDEIRLGGTYLDVAPKAGILAPAAPTGIAGTVVDQNQVNLSWTNNATNQMGFTIEKWNGTSWSTIERLYNTSPSGTVIIYKVTNLAPASTSQFRVSAFNSANSSATNGTGNLTTLAAAPAKVTNLAVTVNSGQFNLTWSDVANETGYVLQYADATGLRKDFNNGELAWQTVTPNLAANITSYNFTNLLTNKLYYFRIYAVNAGGTSGSSNTPSATAFPGPTGLGTAPISDSSVLVSWTENIVGEAGYTVQYSSNNGATWTTGATTGSGVSQAAITGLSPNTVYLFRVQAFAPGSTGIWSANIMGRTYATLTGQIASDGFNYLAGGGANMNGQGSGNGWTGNWTLSDAPNTTILPGSQTYSSLLTSGNKVQLYTSAKATRTLSTTLGTDGTSLWIGYELNQHVSGGSATLRSSVVLGSDPNNWLALGSPWNDAYDGLARINGSDMYMQAGANPVAPADNTPVFLVYRIDFNSGATGDAVHVWVNPALGSTPVDANANSTWQLGANTHFNFTDNNLALQGGGYYVQATFDELRLGSNYASITPVNLPTAPTGLAATPGTGTVALSWTDTSSNEQGFHVQRSTDQVNWSTVQTLTGTSWTDTSLANGTYYYRVSSYNGTGDSLPASATATVGGGLPTVTASVTDSAAAEASSNTGTFRITRTGATTAALVVNYAMTGTASNSSGVDYTLSGTFGTATIPIGSTFVDVTLTPVDDAGVEGSETAVLTISNSGNYSIGSPGNGTVNIADNDVASGLIAADSFSYTTGSLNGKGTAGSGWAGAWSANSNPTVGATSLTPPVSLATSGGSVSTSVAGYGATRNLSSALNSNGTVWSSLLITPDMAGPQTPRRGSVTIGNTTIVYAAESDGLYHWDISGADGSWYGSHWNAGTNPAAVDATTYFIVVEQIFNGGNDTVYVWINPTPGSTAPSTASAFETRTGINAGGTSTTINLGSSYYSNTKFDEVRIGTTYADVAPTSATPPAAPSNLVATPGTSSIVLTWNDNSGANETGFKIWRSTDNATWGSPITTTAANATTYTDSTASPGVGYYYKVAATNGAGDSSSAGMSFAVATVIAYDGIGYTAGSGTNFNGGTGGVGFTGGWSVVGTASSDTVNSGSLSYTSGSNALLTTGNSVTLTTEGSAATRPVNYTFGTDDTSLWVGFAMKQHITTGQPGSMLSGLWLGNDANNHLELGSPWNGFYDGQAFSGGTRLYWNGSGVAPTDNATVFLVYRIDFGHQAGNTSPDKVYLWVNPTPGTQPSDASATTTWTLGTGTYFNFTDSNIRLQSGSYWNQTTYDEVRLGLSYVAVAPDPIVESAAAENRHDHPRRGPAVKPFTPAPMHPPVTLEQAVARFVATAASLPALETGEETAPVVTFSHRIAPLVSMMTSESPTRVVDLTPDLATITATARRHVPGLDAEDPDEQAESFWE